MANIVINEISDNYTYNIGTSSYATIAMPITASWGPAYLDPASMGTDIDGMLEEVTWQKFPATQAGLESFVATYRGPESNYKIAEDYSYQMAMTLLTAGYDILACRVCPGSRAAGGYNFTIDGATKKFTIQAKYPGTFGNNLRTALVWNKVSETSAYWNLITYIVDSINGIQSAVENLVFVFDEESATDSIPYVGELESAYLTFNADYGIKDIVSAAMPTVVPVNAVSGVTPDANTTLGNVLGGTDNLNIPQVYGTTVDNASGQGGTIHKSGADYYTTVYVEPTNWSTTRTSYFTGESTTESSVTTWTFTACAADASFVSGAIYKKIPSATDAATAAAWATTQNTAAIKEKGTALATIRYGQGITTEGYYTGMGTDNPASTTYVSAWTNCTISDDTKLSALAHMEWVYNAALLVYQLLEDKLNYNPQRVMSPGWDDMNVYKLSGNMFSSLDIVAPLHQIIMQVAYYGRCATGLIDIPKSCPRGLVYGTGTSTGYAQLLARNSVAGSDANARLFTSHSTLFAPWGQYKFVGTGKLRTASPSFLAMMIQRAQILNQPTQYEWALPTNRRHNLSIGQMDYTVPKKLLDIWQKLEGVGVNVITKIPDLGINLWGNSTLFEVPPATYQALANLSTRYLVNAIENVAYTAGLTITFQYNNNQAYSTFYSGVTPILDAAKNVGAIDDYYVKMSADINGLDQVNANSVVGKIYLTLRGVVNDITIDLIALPPGIDLSQFAS